MILLSVTIVFELIFILLDIIIRVCVAVYEYFKRKEVQITENYFEGTWIKEQFLVSNVKFIVYFKDVIRTRHQEIPSNG